MDSLTFILLVIVLCIILFLVYYFFKDAKGDLTVTSPVESRVDEYLDRRFQSMVEDWQLVTRTRLAKFQDQYLSGIEQEEARVAELKNYESGMKNTLSSLEARLDVLEKELAGKGNAKK